MSKELLFSNNIAYLPGIKAAVRLENDDAASRSTTGKITSGMSGGSGIKVAKWGDDNNFPGMIRDILAKDAEMKELINTCVLYALGKGVTAFQETGVDAEGNPILKAINDPEIRAFYNSRMVKKYLHEGLIDLFTYFNVFPEMIPTKNRDKIHGIYVNEAFHCRWEEMGDDGVLKRVIHNKNWPNAKLTDTNETTLIRALDPYDLDILTSTKLDKSLTKWIYPVSYPTIGQTYYQVAHWDGLRVSGWLDIAAKIPEFKAAMLKNQMAIKYLIRIPNTYWPSKYPNWMELDEAQQLARKKETLMDINKSLTDVENSGKSILNEVGYDPITKEKLPGWEIDVIDDKTKPGQFLEDSQEASAFKMRALGLDNAIVGHLMTGKGMGAGSGSDKRIAWNLFITKIQPYRDIIADPLKFIAEFNGWTDKYPGFTLGFRDTVLQTLDKEHKTSGEAVNDAA